MGTGDFPKGQGLFFRRREAALIRAELPRKGGGGAHGHWEPGRGAVFTDYLGFPSKPLSLCAGHVCTGSASRCRPTTCPWQLEQEDSSLLAAHPGGA